MKNGCRIGILFGGAETLGFVLDVDVVVEALVMVAEGGLLLLAASFTAFIAATLTLRRNLVL